MADEAKKKNNSNLKERVISALVMLPVALFFIYVGGVAFNMLAILAAILMAQEWYTIVSSSHKVRENDNLSRLWLVCGVFYVCLPVASLIALRAEPRGLYLVLWIFCVVWATDIFAYFAGRKIGGPKLMPKVSPKKTWSGLVGGILGAMLVGVIAASLNSHFSFRGIIFSGLLAILAQAGDLLESWIKRYFNVKDSGTIIPGHGGLLDRVDGLILVVPLVLLAQSLSELF